MTEEENEDLFDDVNDIEISDETGGLYEHLNLVVDKKQEPLRIDKYLLLFRQNSTRNKNFANLSCRQCSG